MSSGSQAALGCTCGNPKARNVMHRSESPCIATYAAMPAPQLVPDTACKQGKCAATTTGCWGTCSLHHAQPPGLIPVVLGHSVTVVYPPSNEEIDYHLDAVLRASGSALRHYSMQKTKDAMRQAMRAAMEHRHA